jgi:hypothetical protein
LITEHGAARNAEVYRDDWRVGRQQVACDELHLGFDGEVANFTSILRDPREAFRLSSLWEPSWNVQR